MFVTGACFNSTATFPSRPPRSVASLPDTAPIAARRGGNVIPPAAAARPLFPVLVEFSEKTALPVDDLGSCLCVEVGVGDLCMGQMDVILRPEIWISPGIATASQVDAGLTIALREQSAQAFSGPG